ncbi:copper chaperone PCu(A)C [Pimelobacter simplex]|uniref:Copper chaperone PCu(A)C n=1 Tax=Nocardioides simplex TaxID=2045 RepID=A0A7J5E1K1_NOCSI|nr:hypothetical protein [Pimelobacter simplex]KAB2812115.1 copper chaperone PCu(A)C [Pimelobacter simplex]
MPLKRPTAIAGLLLALVPAAATLSSCGFDYPTDRVNTIAAGVNNRDGEVKALGIRVLATAKGEGRLIGALVNNGTDDASLTEVSSPSGISAGEFEPIEVAPNGTVNLAHSEPQVPLTGDFTAGNVVTLEFTFSNGQSFSLDVPVVKRCFQYTEIPTEAPSSSHTEKPKGGSEDGAAADAAADEEGGHDDATDPNFSCADEAPSPGGGEAH